MDTNKTIDLNNLKQDKSLTFLYKNIFGRIILKVITLPFVSAIVGKYMSSSLSKGRIEKFITQNNINMDEYEKADYKSFNEFFTRKIKAQHTKFFSVSCAFFSFINHLFINDFCCSVANNYRLYFQNLFSYRASLYLVTSLY